MIRHFVKIFYGNFMDTLEREVNEYLSKSDFSTVAEIQDIKISPESMVVMPLWYIIELAGRLNNVLE